jgi:DNA-binding SARP family transcriptional activator
VVVNVRILGPVAVDGADGAAIDVPKERALLDGLALEVGHAVPLHRLIDGVWGDDVPATAAKTLQGLVFRLRRTLGPDAVTTVGNSYALSLDPDEVALWFGVVIRALAGVASRAGDVAASARLWGASTTMTPPWPGLLRYELSEFERVRELLGDAFEVEADAGRALSADEALRVGASLRV